MIAKKGGTFLGKLKKDSRGLTFVELLVSVSISALIMLSLVFFLNQGVRNYRNITAEVSLQTEAQMLMNQISHFILEAYNVKYDPSGMLTLYQESMVIIITLDETNKELNFEKYDIDGEKIGNTNLLGKYVEGFYVIDTGEDNSNNKIKISLNLKNGNNSYEIKEQVITLRNQIKTIP